MSHEMPIDVFPNSNSHMYDSSPFYIVAAPVCFIHLLFQLTVTSYLHYVSTNGLMD